MICIAKKHDDTPAIADPPTERAVLIQALREIEALALRAQDCGHADCDGYMRIYSKACAALNYAEVTE